MTFEAQAAAVERAVQLVGGVDPEASTSGEYYAGVRAAFNEALRKGRLSREAEASLREAMRAIDEIFQSSHPQFYAGRAGDWVRLAVFGLAIGMLHFFVSAHWAAIPAGVITLIAYRLMARHLGARLGTAVAAGLPWCALAAAGSLLSGALAELAAIAGAWLYDRSGGLRW